MAKDNKSPLLPEIDMTSIHNAIDQNVRTIEDMFNIPQFKIEPIKYENTPNYKLDKMIEHNESLSKHNSTLLETTIQMGQQLEDIKSTNRALQKEISTISTKYLEVSKKAKFQSFGLIILGLLSLRDIVDFIFWIISLLQQ